jgi:hypothetical protein
MAACKALFIKLKREIASECILIPSDPLEAEGGSESLFGELSLEEAMNLSQDTLLLELE